MSEKVGEARRPIVPLGTRVPPYGEVVAVGAVSGERYYWLVKDRGRAAAMMPADVIEGRVDDRTDATGHESPTFIR